MNIYIPTRGRATEQRAYAQLFAANLDPVLVVDPDEAEQYDPSMRKLVMPFVGGIGDKRQWIMEQNGLAKMAMVDDDLRFHKVFAYQDTSADTGWNGYTEDPTPFDLHAFFRVQVFELLDTFAHGGMVAKFFAFNWYRKFSSHMVNKSHYRQVLFYNPALMVPAPPTFSGNDGDEDTRFLLDLLDLGLDFFIATPMCFSEKRSRSLPTHFSEDFKRESIRRVHGLEKYRPFLKKHKLTSTIDYARYLEHVKSQRGK